MADGAVLSGILFFIYETLLNIVNKYGGVNCHYII